MGDQRSVCRENERRLLCESCLHRRNMRSNLATTGVSHGWAVLKTPSPSATTVSRGRWTHLLLTRPEQGRFVSNADLYGGKSCYTWAVATRHPTQDTLSPTPICTQGRTATHGQSPLDTRPRALCLQRRFVRREELLHIATRHSTPDQSLRTDIHQRPTHWLPLFARE